MVYKPLDRKKFLQYIKSVGWTLEKGGIDWNLYDENNIFLCSIKIAHGKNTKEEVIANSVDKVKKIFKEKGMVMASKQEKEIDSHLATALKEIGEIEPWFDKDFNAWIFSHPLYPVEYAGNTEKEVIQNYPLYMREFIKHRLQDRLSPLMENKTKGRGGKRVGAGRPKGSKEKKERVYVPEDIARLLREPGALTHLREFVKFCHNIHI